MPAIMQECKLCGCIAELQESHIVPKFVIRWLRNSSAGSPLRAGGKPNVRIQDGPKLHLLCLKCEEQLSQWETLFARHIFQPYHENQNAAPTLTRYSKWMLKFAVSVSWRVLEFFYSELVQQSDSETKLAIDDAREAWKQFLLDKQPNPGQFEQHMLPLDLITSYSGHSISAYLNRYILTTLDMDFASTSQTAFIYSKLGKYCLFGFVKYPEQDRKIWKGTKIHLNNGFLFDTKKLVTPDNVMSYLMLRANSAQSAINSISPRQYGKISQWTEENIDQYIETDAFRALIQDVNFFGRNALRPEE